MKLATLLLLGVVSADTCHQRLEKQTREIEVILDNYPSEDPHLMKAKNQWGEFLEAVDQSCTETEEAFSCQTSKQAQILKQYDAFSSLVDRCGSDSPAADLGRTTAALIHTAHHCQMNEPTMSMIQIGFSHESQTELKKESDKFTLEYNKLMANPQNKEHLNKMLADYQKWAKSDEVNKLVTDVKAAHADGKFKSIIDELQEAIDSLDEASTVVDNSHVKIENDKINGVVRDFLKVDREIDIFGSTETGNEIVEDYLDAINEEHYKNIRKEQAKIYDSDQGRKTIKQAYELMDEILDEVEISDWPTNN
mmetsp:Transcript_42686/g.65497  ORF Transcript_42686/g.65497 Transcript_42686/m.65497 type:complete len:308 (-) Transcript_42686:38-961(-)|eukprot:CAMPEP_0170479242 /NCGR_PEP_ID=MMETSP0208-20121228/547_1 /TAXON_ID=197538 /ORGANISM="Strombidium inclinatum, Strain S3" /LENGTH=307 /DNA_ID=CAMNT_0010751601 /DNA_START=42 /DNA_END=965 /DNA_ORIENTATION=-